VAKSFRIYATQSIADSILVFAFDEMNHAFPKTEFTITISEHDDPYNLPDLSNYDLFIGTNVGDTFNESVHSNDFVMETIFTDSFSVVIDRQHPLARRKFLDIEEILDYKLILHKYDFTVDSFYEKIIQPQVYHKKLDILLRSDNSRVIQTLLTAYPAILITNNVLATNDYTKNEDLVMIPSAIQRTIR